MRLAIVYYVLGVIGIVANIIIVLTSDTSVAMAINLIVWPIAFTLSRVERLTRKGQSNAS